MAAAVSPSLGATATVRSGGLDFGISESESFLCAGDTAGHWSLEMWN